MNTEPSTWLDLLPKPAPIHGYVTIYRDGELDNEMAVEPEEMRKCETCPETKPLKEFALTKFKGRRCRMCCNKQARERYARIKREMRLNLKGEK